MRHVFTKASLPLLGCAAVLSGCAGQRVASASRSPAAAVPPRPAEPAGLPSAAQVPALAADGSYLTPGRGASAAQAMWSVRAALNVAALACRGDEDTALIAGYNAVLARAKAPLAVAYKAVQAEDRKAAGKGWQAAHDARMTRLYNFFAQPFAKQDFCAASRTVLARAAAVPPTAFDTFAAQALPELEAPFVDGYRRYAAYRQDLAAWDATWGAPGAGPRLAYASLDALLAWTPPAGRQRLASAR